MSLDLFKISIFWREIKEKIKEREARNKIKEEA
jgi:hypothetical protein